MIFAVYIVLFLGLLIAGLNALPDASSLSLPFVSSLSSIIQYMMTWNFLLPISELFSALLLVVAYEVFVWGWHVFLQVVRWVKPSGG